MTTAYDSSIDQYLGEVGRYPLLSADAERALGERVQAGDTAAVEELVRCNLRFVIAIAKEYQRRGLQLSDLIGEGNVGLLAGARKFDPSRGVRFVSYAVWWIRQAIRSAVAMQASIVRTPARRLAETARVRRAADALRQRLVREPTVTEIAKETGLAPEVVRATNGRTGHDLSFDAPAYTDGSQTLLERSSADDDGETDHHATRSLVGARLAEVLTRIPQRNATILRLHYGLDGLREHTLEEIGEQLGVTRERIRQLRDRALRQVHERVTVASREELAELGIRVAQQSGRANTPLRPKTRRRVVSHTKSGARPAAPAQVVSIG